MVVEQHRFLLYTLLELILSSDTMLNYQKIVTSFQQAIKANKEMKMNFSSKAYVTMIEIERLISYKETKYDAQKSTIDNDSRKTPMTMMTICDQIMNKKLNSGRILAKKLCLESKNFCLATTNNKSRNNFKKIPYLNSYSNALNSNKKEKSLSPQNRITAATIVGINSHKSIKISPKLLSSQSRTYYDNFIADRETIKSKEDQFSSINNYLKQAVSVNLGSFFVKYPKSKNTISTSYLSTRVGASNKTTINACPQPKIKNSEVINLNEPISSSKKLSPDKPTHITEPATNNAQSLKIKNVDLSVCLNIQNSSNKTSERKIQMSKGSKTSAETKRAAIAGRQVSNGTNQLSKDIPLDYLNNYNKTTKKISISDIKKMLDEKSKKYLHFSYDEFLRDDDRRKNSESSLSEHMFSS